MRISDWSSDVCSSDLQWQAFVKPFIEQAWPRQVKFRTESASRGFAHLVEQSGDNFPDAVRTVLSLLRPVAHTDLRTYRLVKEPEAANNDFSTSFPADPHPLIYCMIGVSRYELTF